MEILVLLCHHGQYAKCMVLPSSWYLFLVCQYVGFTVNSNLF